MGRSGSHTYFQYGEEPAFKTPPASKTRVFGMEQKVTPVSINQNIIELQDLNKNTLDAFSYGIFGGSFNVDFVWSNPWLLSLIFGDPTVTGVGPFTHTWINTVTPKITPLVAKSFTGEIGSALELANVVREPKGSWIDNVRLSSRLGDLVRGTAACNYAKEDPPGTTLDATPAADSEKFPYSFASGKFQLPDGTTLAEVQAFELNLNPSIQSIPDHDTEIIASLWRGLMRMTGRFNLTAKDATWINNVRGRAELATATFVFDNKLVGTAQKKITMRFKGVGLNTHDASYSPNELSLEDVPLVFREPDLITALNNTSVAP